MYNIIAEITLLSDCPAPKANGVKDGYFPHHKFENIDYLASGRHFYGDTNIHFPGETLTAKIAFPSWEFMCGKIQPGDSFVIMEMNRLVGKGVVKVIF